MTKIINLFGGPGAGKSTTAAGLFYRMKKSGMSVELISEYAKDLVWSESLKVLEDQVYVAAKQNRKQHRLLGKVEWIITDSPIVLSAYYAKYCSQNKEMVRNLAYDLFNSYENINIFIQRTKPFVSTGRLCSEGGALKTDKELKEMLRGIEGIELEDNEHIINSIMEALKC